MDLFLFGIMVGVGVTTGFYMILDEMASEPDEKPQMSYYGGRMSFDRDEAMKSGLDVFNDAIKGNNDDA